MTDYKNSYYIPSTVVSAFFLLSYLILTKTKGILILHEKKKKQNPKVDGYRRVSAIYLEPYSHELVRERDLDFSPSA